MLDNITLVGKKVKLVPLECSHSHDLYAAARNEEIWTYLSKNVKSLDDMANLVEEALQENAKGTQYPFTVGRSAKR